MLRITTSEQDDQVFLKIEGKLSGPWVAEFERSWRMSSRRNKDLVVELSGLTFVDGAGKKLLSAVAGEGGRLVGSGLVAKSLVDEIGAGHKSPKTPHKTREEVARVVLMFVLPLIAASTCRAQNAAPLSLSLHDAVTMALKENSQVQVAALRFAESQQDTAVSRAALLPQAGVEVLDRAERFNIDAQFGSKFPGIPQHAGPFQFFQAGPIATMPLFDLTLWRRWQAAHQENVASQSEESAVREQVVLLVVSQYLVGLRDNAAVRAAQSRVDLAQALYDQASDLQKHGVGTGIDTLRSNVELQNEKQRLLEAETQEKVALYGLSRLLHLDPHQSIELADTPSFYQTPEVDTNQSLESAYETRPEMKEISARQHMAELARRGASESRLPTVNFYGTWGQQGLSAPAAIPAYIYQVTIDVPLFTSGRIRAQIARANLELQTVEQQRTDLRDRIALEVKTSEAQLSAARHEVDVANLGMKLADQEVAQARDRFQAGVANNIEVVTAQDALARANDNQIAALYRYNQSRADLSHAMGEIEGMYSR